METTKYRVTATLLEAMLGTIPKNPEVYATWVKLKTVKEDEAPPEFTEEKAWTGFHSDAKGLFIYDYMIKGFLKEAASILPEELSLRNPRGNPLGVATIKRRVDNWVFVYPRRIYLGKLQPDGFLERPLRATTMQGERITLVRSDSVNAGTQFEFEIVVLPSCPITEANLRAWLDYGQLKGLGQWRNAGYGRFTYELVKIVEQGKGEVASG